MSKPSPLVPVDDLVRGLAGQLDRGAQPELVWTNPMGGRTYRMDHGGDIQYLKVSPAGAPASHDLVLEAERLAWILGVADRAADLGCHIWSLAFNQLGDVIEEFLDAYGFTGDRAAVQWYRDFYTVA